MRKEPRRNIRATPATERVWRHVDKGAPDDCWEWRGSRNEAGYGRIGDPRYSNHINRAHRVAYEATHGDIPNGGIVCHKCDNPPCCNPAHLFISDRAGNAKDRHQKGRDAHQRGSASGGAKLTEDDVTAMRAARSNGTSIRKLTELYSISNSQVRRIVTGASWGHLTSDREEVVSD